MGPYRPKKGGRGGKGDKSKVVKGWVTKSQGVKESGGSKSQGVKESGGSKKSGGSNKV